MSRLALQMTCYNGAKYLPYVFASLAAQTEKEWMLYFLDNGSSAEEAVAIKAAIDASGIPIQFERVEETLNFANGHNRLFAKHDAEFVQLMNDDAILEPTYLAQVLEFMIAHPSCGSASGRIYRWDFDHANSPSHGKTDRIDSLGLEKLATGMVRDRFRFTALTRIPECDLLRTFVWGVSGCLPMYRRSLVLASSPDATLFDPTFVAYKEDVDVAYRLEAIGATSAIVHGAVAYHRRTFARGSHAAQKFETQLRSYRNHWWMILMHWRLRDVLLRFVPFFAFEFAKFCYWLLRGPRVIVDTVRDTRHEWANILRKRRMSMQLRRTKGEGHFVPLAHPSAPYTFAVVTVSHNDLNEPYFLSLKSAIAATKERVQVIIADNNSTAYKANEFVDHYLDHDVTVVLRNGDFGFGRSNNRALREVRAQYVLFLNPDTVMPDVTFFDQLKTFLDENPESGIVAPRIHHFDGELQETCRRFPRWFMPFIQRTGLGKTRFGQRYADAFLMRDYDHKSLRMVDWVQGSAMCIAVPFLEELGGFDDRFWMYFEDIDLCRRVWNAGHPVYYYPDLVIRHAYGKASSSGKNPILETLMNTMARAHIVSWFKYQWKWRIGDYL